MVMLLDHRGLQAPSLQGMFQQVSDNIKRLFEDKDVEWYYRDGEDKKVSSKEWFSLGSKINEQLPEKAIDTRTLINRGLGNSSDL